MSKYEDRYLIENDSFVHSSIPKISGTDTTYGIKETRFPYIHAPHTQNPHNPCSSRVEIIPHAQTFCSNPEHVYVTQCSDRFVTYTKGSNMHTGQPNPHSVINEYIRGKLTSDPH